MKKNLLFCFFVVCLSTVSFAQTLYNNSTLVGNIFNPGRNGSGNPLLAFDEVLIPSTTIGSSDSIFVTKVKFGIYRAANAVATTVDFYYTPTNDTATQFNTLTKIPPVLIGSINLEANGATAVQTVISVGDSVNTLFKVRADTGDIYTDYAMFFLGVKFSTTNGAHWRFATGDANDDVLWIYNPDSTAKTFATFFGGTPRASFFTQVYGYPKAVLPISLSTFSASFVNSNVQLNWKTASESNSSHFDIEASKNGSDFYSIGKVNASGFSSTTKSYSFVHIKPGSGTYYYRIKLIDKDNSYKFSSIEKLSISSKALQLEIFPNPIASHIRFNWLDEGSYKYKLTGITGKQFMVGAVTKGLNELNVSTLAKGVYILNILDNKDQIIGSKKLIK